MAPKEGNAGIFCNKRSDVDEGTKKNLVPNMERKIERWEQLKTNGYGVRKKGKIIDKEERGKEGENTERWYGITSIGQYTEGIKAILKKEEFTIFRKGGEKLEAKVKQEYKKGNKRR